MTREELIKAGYIIGNREGTLNPFEPPMEMPAHVASVHNLLSSIQRKRREPQVMAEIGVWQGSMSRWLLTTRPGLTLHMVDPFLEGEPGSSWREKGDKFGKKSQAQHDQNYALVCQLAKQFKPRGHVHRLKSVEAAPQFKDGLFDLVFIDGAHDYENVYADVHAWRKKVRPGGWLSGHDYKTDGNYFGLIRAVNKATEELGLRIEVHTGKVWACKIPE